MATKDGASPVKAVMNQVMEKGEGTGQGNAQEALVEFLEGRGFIPSADLESSGNDSPSFSWGRAGETHHRFSPWLCFSFISSMKRNCQFPGKMTHFRTHLTVPIWLFLTPFLAFLSQSILKTHLPFLSFFFHTIMPRRLHWQGSILRTSNSVSSMLTNKTGSNLMQPLLRDKVAVLSFNSIFHEPFEGLLCVHSSQCYFSRDP